jgi:hypothetical protein
MRTAGVAVQDSSEGLRLLLVHADDCLKRVTVKTELPKSPEALRLECTANLLTDTLSFAFQDFDLSALTISIPPLSECFIYAASMHSFSVDLQPYGEQSVRRPLAPNQRPHPQVRDCAALCDVRRARHQSSSAHACGQGRR